MTKLTDSSISTLSAVPDDDDLFHVVDRSDTTHGAAGTSKKVAYGNIKSALFSRDEYGTITLTTPTDKLSLGTFTKLGSGTGVKIYDVVGITPIAGGEAFYALPTASGLNVLSLDVWVYGADTNIVGIGNTYVTNSHFQIRVPGALSSLGIYVLPGQTNIASRPFSGALIYDDI